MCKPLRTRVIVAVLQIVQTALNVGVVTAIRVRIATCCLHRAGILIPAEIIPGDVVGGAGGRGSDIGGVALDIGCAHGVRAAHAHAVIDAGEVQIQPVSGAVGGVGDVEENHAAVPDGGKGCGARLANAFVVDIVGVSCGALGVGVGGRAVHRVVSEGRVLRGETAVLLGELIARGIVSERNVVHDIARVVGVCGGLALQPVGCIIRVRCHPVHGRGAAHHIAACVVRGAVCCFVSRDGGAGVVHRDDVAAAVVGVGVFVGIHTVRGIGLA